MIKIGDFSRLSHVSVKALRLYDELGLLKPVQVDAFTSYRYYALEQLPRLNRIIALKELGFTLEQIINLLQRDLPLDELRGMLKLKRAEVEQRLNEEQDRLQRIEARLRQIELENTMSNYDVVIKPIEPQWVATVRRSVPTYKQVGVLYGEIYPHLGRYGLMGGITGAIWHEESYTETDVDAEAFVSIKIQIPSGGGVTVYELPAAQVASIVHHGAYASLSRAYEAVAQWIDSNGYRIVGPNRELYLYCAQPARQDDETYVTEIQFPVEQA